MQPSAPAYSAPVVQPVTQPVIQPVIQTAQPASPAIFVNTNSEFPAGAPWMSIIITAICLVPCGFVPALLCLWPYFLAADADSLYSRNLIREGNMKAREATSALRKIWCFLLIIVPLCIFAIVSMATAAAVTQIDRSTRWWSVSEKPILAQRWFLVLSLDCKPFTSVIYIVGVNFWRICYTFSSAPHYHFAPTIVLEHILWALALVVWISSLKTSSEECFVLWGYS